MDCEARGCYLAGSSRLPSSSPTPPPPLAAPARITAAYRLCGCHQRVTRIRRPRCLNSPLFFPPPPAPGVLGCAANLAAAGALRFRRWNLTRQKPAIQVSSLFFFALHRSSVFAGIRFFVDVTTTATQLQEDYWLHLHLYDFCNI